MKKFRVFFTEKFGGGCQVINAFNYTTYFYDNEECTLFYGKRHCSISSYRSCDILKIRKQTIFDNFLDWIYWHL